MAWALRPESTWTSYWRPRTSFVSPSPEKLGPKQDAQSEPRRIENQTKLPSHEVKVAHEASINSLSLSIFLSFSRYLSLSITSLSLSLSLSLSSHPDTFDRIFNSAYESPSFTQTRIGPALICNFRWLWLFLMTHPHTKTQTYKYTYIHPRLNTDP